MVTSHSHILRSVGIVVMSHSHNQTKYSQVTVTSHGEQYMVRPQCHKCAWLDQTRSQAHHMCNFHFCCWLGLSGKFLLLGLSADSVSCFKRDSCWSEVTMEKSALVGVPSVRSDRKSVV